METRDTNQVTTFTTGAIRQRKVGRGRYDLLPHHALERDARLYEKGGLIHGDRNWEKGMPVSVYMDSLMHHWYLHMAGDRTEDHLAAIRFNAAGVIHVEEGVRAGTLPAELLDLPTTPRDIIEKLALPGLGESMLKKPADPTTIGDGWNGGPVDPDTNKAFFTPSPGVQTPATYKRLQLFGKEYAFRMDPVKEQVLRDYSKASIADLRRRPLKRLNIYVAGPFSAPTLAGRMENSQLAVQVGLAVFARGHRAHVPHAATAPMDGHLQYEDFMDLDFSIIERWADAVIRYAPSPGADREAFFCRKHSKPLFLDLDSIPIWDQADSANGVSL